MNASAGWSLPYEGIIVITPIPQPLLDQLSSESRLLIPVGLPYSYQEMLVIEHSRLQNRDS
jgi:protein-L-isoaspartate(D-aspartate) O-methyltransferase